MRPNLPIKLFVIALFVFLLAGLSVNASEASVKEKKAAVPRTKAGLAKPGDCAACHKTKKMYSDSHVPTKEMPYEGCLVCHTSAEGKAGTLRGKMPGSHLHALRGITCEKCHGKVKNYKPVEMSKCVSCHGDPAKLAQRTANVKPENPHKSPHYGTSADCNLCHRQHAKSENLCAQCHKFNYTVP